MFMLPQAPKRVWQSDVMFLIDFLALALRAILNLAAATNFESEKILGKSHSSTFQSSQEEA